MSDGARTFAVRQVFYAGVGGAGVAFCCAGAVAFHGSWSSYALLLFAAVCAVYVVRNIGLAYVLDEHWLTRASRWGAQRRVAWSSVIKIKYFDRGMTLVLLLRDGSRFPVRCGELADPDGFHKAVQRHAVAAGGQVIP